MRKIYLDHGATTPVDKKVLAAMMPYFSDKFGNAMSIHNFGSVANEAVEKSRKQTADFFGAQPEEMIFTSGATESNNLVVKGVLNAYYFTPKALGAQHEGIERHRVPSRPHIITTAFEHHCVLDSCKEVEKEGLAEVTYIKPNKDGIIKVEDIKKAIKSNTILVSVMYVNNEIGTVQSIAEIGNLLRNTKKIRNTKVRTKYPIFHTDATQAINYFDCNVDKFGVDLLSMSAHKIYGPKGIGALYIRKGTPIKRVQDGGGQENNKRAGTHNVPGIVGLGAAMELVKKEKVKGKSILEIRNYLIERVLKEIPQAKLNGSKIKRSPNNANFSFKNVEGESLLMMLDMEGIAASTGSACTSGNLEPSHVLMSLGMKHEDAHGSLRLTLGKSTTKKEIDYTVNKLKKIVEKIRKVSGKVLEEYYSKK
ncbi:MAG: cysteine desulfurase family protein [Parcubacteria group bacterium]|jgi:cysteine desulfurase